MADNIQPNAPQPAGIGPTALRAQAAPVTAGSIPTADSPAAQKNQDSEKIKTANEYSADFGSGEEIAGDDSLTAGVMLLLTYAVRHVADAQFSQACAKHLAKLTAEQGKAHNPAQIRMPAHDVQQNIGHGQFAAVESKPESPEATAAKIVPLNATANTPQVSGRDPLGHNGVVADAVPANEVSVGPTSNTTAAPIAPNPAADAKTTDAKK